MVNVVNNILFLYINKTRIIHCNMADVAIHHPQAHYKTLQAMLMLHMS